MGMKRGNMPSAPDYTNAALVMGLVNLLLVFMVLWASFGLTAVLATAFGLDRLIVWLSRRN